jgi:hypothetical protein
VDCPTLARLAPRPAAWVVCRLTQQGLVAALAPWEDAPPEFDRCSSVIKEGRAMATLTADLEKRLKRLPQDLHGEFPDVPADTIERTVDAGARELLAQARFHDFVPVLVHKAVRAQLLARS